MGRAVSLSLAAHAVFIIWFLLVSAARQPLLAPQVARPVRLVTYLEPPAAPRARVAPPAGAAAGRPPAAQTAPRVLEPPPAAAPPAARPPLSPIPAPRSVIPAPAPVSPPPARAATPPAEPPPALSERLARRLAAVAPAESRQDAAAPPQVASLPRVEPPAPAPGATSAAPGTPAQPPASVEPVGYFPHAWYLAVLKETIFARWSPPGELFQKSRLPTALVSFRIDRAGRISRLTLKEGSGSARFDQSALAAVQGLGQLPPLPEPYGEETLDVVIRFQNQK